MNDNNDNDFEPTIYDQLDLALNEVEPNTNDKDFNDLCILLNSINLSKTQDENILIVNEMKKIVEAIKNER